LQSFVRTRRKADVIAFRGILGHDDVDVIHGVESVWPDVAPSSETPGGYVGQTSPLRAKCLASVDPSLACQT